MSYYSEYSSEWQGIDDDDEEELDYESSSTGGRDALLLVIDVTDGMFEKNKGESAFDLSIKCVRNVMTNKIFSSDKDLIGVVFFGTKITKNSCDFRNITVFQDLDELDADKILGIEALLQKNNGNFEQKFGHSDAFSLSDVFWICSSLFKNCTKKLGSKRILLFTNNDDPHKGNKQLQYQARQKASDLYEMGIEIDLLHLKNSFGVFDVNKFYKNLIFLSEDEDSNIHDPSDKFDELMSRTQTKHHKKRRLANLSFSLGKGLTFGVSVYSLVRSMTLPTAVKLNKANNEELKTKRNTYRADTGEILMPQELKKYQIFGAKRIALEQEELRDIKKFYDPGLTLMGFKPRSKLKDYYHIRAAHFLYPDEDSIGGSSQLFTALLMKCLERDVIPICRYTLRQKTAPHFVALIPQKEEVAENNVQITPPGFHVIFLPFSDDIRALNVENQVRANETQIDNAKQMLKKIKFKFSSESLENPVVHTHWKNIEALALDRHKPEETVDYIKPDHNLMSQRMGATAEQFKDSVYVDGYNPEESSTKRKPAKATGGSAAKRTKADGEETETVNIKTEAKNGTLHKLTVNVLKDFCQNAGIKTTGLKKAELLDAVYSFLKITPP